MRFTWLPEALKAQAVVARSFPPRHGGNGAFDLYPDTRSQVYLGIEHAEAVYRTPRSMQRLVRSCCNPGLPSSRRHSSSPPPADARGIGESLRPEPVPYLVSVVDPYDSISPHHDRSLLLLTGTGACQGLEDEGAARRRSATRAELVRPSASGPNVVGTKSTLAMPGAGSAGRLGVRLTGLQIGVLSLAAPSQPVTFGGRGKLAGLACGL